MLGRYVFQPGWRETRVFRNWESYWGRSDVRPTSGFIASISNDGTGAVGIGHEHCIAVARNSIDGHRCAHSMPYFGTLLPGQEIVRRGVILFGRSAEELFDRFETLGYRPDSAAPTGELNSWKAGREV
jgi:hypothetical protein